MKSSKLKDNGMIQLIKEDRQTYDSHPVFMRIILGNSTYKWILKASSSVGLELKAVIPANKCCIYMNSKLIKKVHCQTRHSGIGLITVCQEYRAPKKV
jgi:hypothetical protein